MVQKENILIEADLVGLERLFYTAGESTAIELTVEGGQKHRY